MSKLGPYSKEIALARCDGRSKEGRLLNQMRRELAKQLGGNPTAAQRAMIERCAMLQLRVAMLDRKVFDHSFSDYDAKTYIAWSNSLARTLDRLNRDSAPAPRRSLQERLRQEADERVTVLHRAAR